MVRKTDQSLCIYHTYQRHPSPFKDLNFLPVTLCYRVIRIGQADKRELLCFPVKTKCAGTIRPYSQDFGPTIFKLIIIIPQTRQLREAVRSEETAQKSKQDGLAAIIQAVNRTSMDVNQLEFRRRFARVQ